MDNMDGDENLDYAVAIEEDSTNNNNDFADDKGNFRKSPAEFVTISTEVLLLIRSKPVKLFLHVGYHLLTLHCFGLHSPLRNVLYS